MLFFAALTTLTLLVFAVIANEAFISDRTASIFEDAMSRTSSLAGRFTSEIERVQFIHDFLRSSYDLTTYKYRPNTISNSFCQIAINTSAYGILDQTHCESTPLREIFPQMSKSWMQFSDSKYRFQVIPHKASFFLIYVEKPTSTLPLQLVSIVPANNLMDLFTMQSIFDPYIISKDGQILIGPPDRLGQAAENFISQDLISKVNEKTYKLGTLEAASVDGDRVLASYEFLDGTPFVLISSAKKSIVFRSVLPMALRSLFAFLALVALSLSFGLLVSKKITSSIESLRDSMKAFGLGNMDAVVETQSNDEIGQLAKYFNDMTKRIKSFVAESAQKAAMQKEVETTKRVQETLLPASYAKFEGVEIAGHYEPANECGGDWWYYFRQKNKLYVCIGDVTGHGLPSALMTSATRSAISLLEREPNLRPAHILEKMNIAIFETARGELQMTFFAAMLDLDTGAITYANASHEPPMVLPPPADKITMSQIDYLQEAMGPRLGEKLDSQYQEYSSRLALGSRLFLYTDGILAIRNQQNEEWKERDFRKALLAASSGPRKSIDIISSLNKSIFDFRGFADLPDDLSFFMVDYQTQASKGPQEEIKSL
jgi:sigma-B regulation protein RsbU (phosphoserine phosphatase)